jgi:hypothetical protein
MPQEPESKADPVAAVRMIKILVDVPADQRLDTLALLVKVFVEGHLPRFEDAFRRTGQEQ